MTGTPKRLLVLACSQTKHPKPAICSRATDYYDGPAFRMLRKVRAPGPSAVAILSAEYGLIRSSLAIAPYDRKLDAVRALELVAAERKAEARRLVDTLKVGDACMPVTREWDEVFFFGGRLYRSVMHTYEAANVFGVRPVNYACGQIGEQLHQLKQFFQRIHDTAERPIPGAIIGLANRAAEATGKVMVADHRGRRRHLRLHRDPAGWPYVRTGKRGATKTPLRTFRICNPHPLVVVFNEESAA